MDKEQEEGENEAEVKHRTAWIEAEYIVAGWWEQEPNKKLAKIELEEKDWCLSGKKINAWR